MKITPSRISSLALTFLSACCLAQAEPPLLKVNSQISAPVAEKIPKGLSHFSDKRIDSYYWLNDRKSEKVLSYLKSENEYFDRQFASALPLQKKLSAEIRSHIKEDDSSAPLKRGNYFYYKTFLRGKEYPQFVRRTPGGTEEVLFDINETAKGESYFHAEVTVSPDHSKAALIFDNQGRRFYKIKIKDLKSGKFLEPGVDTSTNNVLWGNDSETVYFVKQNPETLRADRLFKFNINSGKTNEVYYEPDSTFEVDISVGLSRRHLLINLMSTLTNELRSIDLNAAEAKIKLIKKRKRGIEFSVGEDDASYYFVTNEQARNFKVTRLMFDGKSESTVIPTRENVFVDHLIAFQQHLVLFTRESGLSSVEIYKKQSTAFDKLSFSDSAYSVEPAENAEYDAPSVRYVYQSLRQPPTTYEYRFADKKSVEIKTREVPNYDKEQFVSERLFVEARDGVKIPVSLLYKKSTAINGTAPLLAYGYGAYGSNSDPWFSVSNVTLAEHSFVFAIIHVRGGGEMGRAWTDSGRQLNKLNSFYDFIDAVEALKVRQYAAPDKIFANGASAGGLLMGAVLNMRPDLFRGVIAEVPFVDVLTTMLDPNVPLTTAEFDEWGNPNNKGFYKYMKKYSPYDNVTPKNYPNILVTTGINDSQVQYWEPAKWVAKLRANNLAKDSLILLKTDMESGHSGKSGRFQQIEEDSLNLAFVIGLLPQ